MPCHPPPSSAVAAVVAEDVADLLLQVVVAADAGLRVLLLAAVRFFRPSSSLLRADNRLSVACPAALNDSLATGLCVVVVGGGGVVGAVVDGVVVGGSVVVAVVCIVVTAAGNSCFGGLADSLAESSSPSRCPGRIQAFIKTKRITSKPLKLLNTATLKTNLHINNSAHFSYTNNTK